MPDPQDPLGGYTPAQLIGFDSLLPSKEKHRNPLVLLVLLPFRLLFLPFRLVGAILTFPFRLLRRGDRATTSR